MDEHADAAGRKHEVGFAGKLCCMQSVPQARSMENTANGKLRQRILAADLPHVSATSRSCQTIDHETFSLPFTRG
jgi:hypothetical protein